MFAVAELVFLERTQYLLAVLLHGRKWPHLLPAVRTVCTPQPGGVTEFFYSEHFLLTSVFCSLVIYFVAGFSGISVKLFLTAILTGL